MRTGCRLLDRMQVLVYNTDKMDRKQIIAKSLNKINEKFHLLFDWLTCEDLGRDLDQSEQGCCNNCQNNKKIVGQDADSDPSKH